MHLKSAPWMACMMAGTLLVAAVGAGCFDSRNERKGFTFWHWNESNRHMNIIMETGYGRPDAGYATNGFGGPSVRERGGGGGIGCGAWPGYDDPDKPDVEEPWPFRITLHDIDNDERWSYYWSDVGCGVAYDFVYHADGTSQLTLVEKDYRITKKDLPRK